MRFGCRFSFWKTDSMNLMAGELRLGPGGDKENLDVRSFATRCRRGNFRLI